LIVPEPGYKECLIFQLYKLSEDSESFAFVTKKDDTERVARIGDFRDAHSNYLDLKGDRAHDLFTIKKDVV
jgi:hypothetical protein